MSKYIKRSRTKEELLENTINFYNTSNRAIDNYECVYRSKDGKACAIGREISDKTASNIIFASGNYLGVSSDLVYDMLPKRLRNLSKSYLIDIQKLHDNHTNWSEEGLSTIGIICVERIMKKYDISEVKYKDTTISI